MYFFTSDTDTVYAPDLISGFEDIGSEFEIEDSMSGVVRVLDTSSCDLTLYYDMSGEHLLLSCDT